MANFIKASFVLFFLGGVAFAGNLLQNALQAKTNSLTGACEPDIKKLCSGVSPDKVVACLKSQPDKLSTACKNQVMAPPANPVPQVKNPLKP